MGEKTIKFCHLHLPDHVEMNYLILQMNDKFNYFPIFGVCLGFEAFITLSNNHNDQQIKCDIIDEYFPLQFIRNFQKSLLYSRVSEDIYVSLKYLDVTANYHT